MRRDGRGFLTGAILALVALYDIVELALLLIGRPYRLTMRTRFEGLRWRLGAWRAWRSHMRAYARVPAYRRHIDGNGPRFALRLVDGIPTLAHLPETDKTSYVAKNRIEEIALDGRLPRRGVVIDESSGSSGKPTSWARGRLERMISRRTMQTTMRDARDRPPFVINGLLLGTWAAGVNVSMSLADVVTIKSTGPDIDKIVGTILQFGPEYRYYVMGYPPFLKMVADDDRLDWDRYETVAGFGGEGISEGLRDYLETRFTRVYGSYGAADLEIGVAAESALTIRLRKAILEDETLRNALIRTEHGVTPLIMQYDPVAYHIESNDAGEMLVTFCRPWNISPRIRYNIHDLGHVMRFPELRRRLKAVGREDLVAAGDWNAALPLLFLYRRSDRSVDYYGVNVTPDGVREALHGMTAFAPSMSTFKLLSYETDDHTKRMEVAVELVPGGKPPIDVAGLAEELFSNLDRVNDDFRGTRAAAPAGNPPRLTIHVFGTGTFAEKRQGRIKDDYI